MFSKFFKVFKFILLPLHSRFPFLLIAHYLLSHSPPPLLHHLLLFFIFFFYYFIIPIIKIIIFIPIIISFEYYYLISQIIIIYLKYLIILIFINISKFTLINYYYYFIHSFIHSICQEHAIFMHSIILMIIILMLIITIVKLFVDVNFQQFILISPNPKALIITFIANYCQILDLQKKTKLCYFKGIMYDLLPFMLHFLFLFFQFCISLNLDCNFYPFF